MVRQANRKVLWLILIGIVCLGLAAGAGMGWAKESPSGSALKVTPYGRVELDVTYSSRDTNPLDPPQFNGYATAAGPGDRGTSTFNPRFSVMGLRAEQASGTDRLDASVEFDFYGSDESSLIAPRLRLAYITYTRGDTRFTVGQDWTPVAALHPDALDFSIMGYGGNLWQRIPQITVRHKIGETLEVLGTLMRFGRSDFDDPTELPYAGVRLAHSANDMLLAVSGAYRQYEYNLTDDSVTSYLAALEWALPVGPVRWAGEAAVGQGLGAEFFRFGQDLNGTEPISTMVGWTQVSLNPSPGYWVAAGYGFDNPDNGDLAGLTDAAHYRFNQRYFVTVVHPIFEGFKVGAEYTHLSTEWSDGQDLSGNQGMLSFFYAF